MSADAARIIGVVIGFVIMLGTGYWLGRAGKPSGQILLTVHKLMAVAMLVFIIWSTVAMSRTAVLTTGGWIVVSLAALVFVILIGTGGALSAMASPPGIIRWAHKAAPYVAVALTGLWLYLLR